MTIQFEPFKKQKIEPYEVIQIKFGHQTISENEAELNFVACIELCSKYPSPEVFEKAGKSLRNCI